MQANKSLSELELAEHQLMLKKQNVQESLLVLKNAHNSLGIIVNQLKQDGASKNEQLLNMVQTELNLIEEEMLRLDFFFKILKI